MKYIIALFAALSLTACASKPQNQPQQPMTYMPQPTVVIIQSQPAPQYAAQTAPQVHYIMPAYQQQYQQPRMVPNPAYVPEQ